VLGWTYLVNDEKVSAIGRYIRTRLGPRLADLVGAEQPVFEWEVRHRTDRRRRSRKAFQLAVDLITFCLPGAVAISVRWAVGHITIFTVVGELAATIMVLFLAQQIIVNADLARETPWSADHADLPQSVDGRFDG
jgi:hypothetical protein